MRAGRWVLGAVLLLPVALHAQDVDRNRRPAPGPVPALVAPKVVERRLSNGLRVWIVERHGLPLFNAMLVLRAGAAEDGARPGLAQMTASLLDDGAGGRSALGFAAAAEGIGAQLSASAGDEATQISLLALTRHADSALALFADMVARPAFAGEEIGRERKARLQALKQQKDQPALVASRVFNRMLFGDAHPYGRPAAGTVASVTAIARRDLTAFYRRYYTPDNATLVVVGDVSPDRITARLERVFAGWSARAGRSRAQPPAPPPAPPAPHATAIYLVDKPGAAQSEIRVGGAGIARRSPDFYALNVLNAALGGQFTSRVNLNLREAKGYTYGAYTAATYPLGPGTFLAGGGVFTAKTDSALVEFVKELRDIRSTRPLTPAELDFARSSLVQAYPRRLETAGGVAKQLAELAFFGLPPAELTGYVAKVGAVAGGDVQRLAARTIHPDSLTIVVVGDAARIRPGLEALGLGPVHLVDAEGRSR